MRVLVVERVGGDDRWPGGTANTDPTGALWVSVPPPAEVPSPVKGAVLYRDPEPVTVCIYAKGHWSKVTYSEEEK